MSYANELSDELAEEYGVTKSEMWGFLAMLDGQGQSEEEALEKAEEVYGDDK